jgi:inorganic pyrophosphatase/K(+)-stimulated pyrophosphate-energized sodium pump
MNILLLAQETQATSDPWMIWSLAPVGAILALVMAYVFSRGVMAHSEGDDDMIEIASHVRAGAKAYLVRQYKVVFVVFLVLVAILAALGFAGIQPIWSAIGVPIAGLFSGLCGWFGMKMATNASARTTFAVKTSLNDGLRVAFRAGAVMGLIVVGFALLDTSVWFYLWNKVMPGKELVEITSIMLTFGMGASTQALFARVGGGIYTKAADVGADLVGKIEAGIPEDDPRNPATIADNVGDNVGDVAGMGADLYESYYGSILATMALGAAAAMGMGIAGDTGIRLAVAPMALAGLGIFCSLAGIFVVRAKEDASFSELLKGLHKGVYVASFLIAVLCGGLFYCLFNGTEVSWLGLWSSIITGLSCGLIIAYATEYYTSYEHAPTRRIAEQTETGAATVIISGIAEGMKSTWAPLIVVVVAIIASFNFAMMGNENFLLGLYGVGIAAVGMLSTLGITLATDAYGPIADNAGGNAEMTGQPAIVRERTDMLDSLGNTTAATGKGFAIGSAALTALALLAAYVSIVQTSLDKKIATEDNLATIVAERGDAVTYLGNGEFVAVNDGNAFGGLLLTSDSNRSKLDNVVTIDERFRANITWNEIENVHMVNVDVDNTALAFSLAPTDKAKIKQLLSYYDVTIMNPKVLGGIFLGVMLAFVFCALTMNAVGRAAYQMMQECRRQFAIMKEAFKANGMSAKEIKDPMNWPKKVIVDGHQFPDYGECVAISTSSAQREMVFPALLAIAVPIIVGLLLGVGGVMGLLVGGLTSGFALAIFMANAGGAWDNAKKYIESGKHGGKGSDAHKASVVGDTVGDPFKDTSGPALNILIKLIAIVSVVFAGLIVNYGPVVAGALGL